ncbi:MAG TPA: serine hydrolase [Clostridia bacterium]|nr:serine hydrolase [Clostridia bacterium]
MMESKEKTRLERAASPEEVGVLTSKISEFIEDLKENEIETHSIMILRRGKVAFETWAQPYAPDIPHVMYSVSKSFTSTAIGFAVEEGLLSLETRVLDILPEYAPEEADENLEKLTIYHLLTMTSGKDMPLLMDRTKDRWIEDFIEAKWKAAPGESFSYINENIYMLCAVLTRLTGMSVSDYLTPRLFEPLGYGRVPFWETDPGGIEAGGWGMYITTEELAKISLCYLQGGLYEGKQVIPKNWVREATKKQVETNRKVGDSAVGYGFCFWQNSLPGSYRLDGMFSQFGIVMEKYDAVIVITACEIHEQKYRDCIWRHFPDAFFDESVALPLKAPPHLSLQLEPLEDLPALPRSSYEKIVHARTLKTQRNRLFEAAKLPLSMLPIAVVYMSANKAGNIDNLEFEFGEKECRLGWMEGKESNSVLCGMDGEARLSEIHLAGMNFTASCTAAWTSEKTLTFLLRPLQAVSQRQVDFVFDGFNVDIYFSSHPPTKKMLLVLSGSLEEYIKNAMAVRTVRRFMENAHKLIEPTMKGRLYRKENLPEKQPQEF